MTPLPRFLKRFQRPAEDLVALGFVKDVEFSGSTYQIRVDDPALKTQEWAFVQLDPQGRLKDSFCSCAESEEHLSCRHQAAAFLYIYHGFDLPLHLRFEKSLWNQICRQFAEELGTDADKLRKEEKGHYYFSVKGKRIFSIKAHNAEALKQLDEMLFERQVETEETSLKFSNLSSDEIALWRQGRPSLKLAYELSFWYDLAKWLMLLQEVQTPYTLSFEYDAKKIPNRLVAAFPQLTTEWTLAKDTLPELIPSFATVNSPLIVHDAWKEVVSKIIYDKAHKSFKIIPKGRPEERKKNLASLNAVDLGEWAYVPSEGFYSRKTQFLIDVAEFNDIENLLNEHAQSIKELIQDCAVKETPSAVSYTISFDSQWNLHIESYLFKPGDLAAPNSSLFGSWAYIAEKGFYRLYEREFNGIDTVIPTSQVSDFVNDHRPWLNAQKGFHTHLTPLEANLSYTLEGNNLIFSRHLAFPTQNIPNKDFGRWVYVAEHGFFSKISTPSALPLRAGTHIAADQIPMFIRLNRDDLQMIKGFFSPVCPVQKSEIAVEMNSQNQIIVTPKYTLLPDYVEKGVRFFDDFAYVDGEGFYELSGDKRLPEGFNSTIILEKDALPFFLERQLPKLTALASYIDPRLLKPTSSFLVTSHIEPLKAEGKEGYLLNLSYQSELGSITLDSLWAALQQNDRYAFTEAGLFDLSEQRFQWIKNLKKSRVDRKRHQLTLSTLEVLRLNALEGIAPTDSFKGSSQKSLQLLRDLTELRAPDEPVLTGLMSHLRPYQLHGVRWLWFLYNHGLSGLLCDDMGLGKTHQTMGLITAIANHYRHADPKTKRHFLIVCPTSVIYHWQEKLKEYVPNLKVWTFYGTNRSLDTFYQDSDILLTSYGIWRNEVATLSKMTFEVAIFDELQIAKNHMSRIYQALLKAKARMRLGLTGTPIENRLRELKTLFDLTLPTYMPSETDYKEIFVRPIEKEFDQTRKQLLSRLIKPFVLRRKKEDVLLDLPEKTEEIAHCDLQPQQAELYVNVLSASRDKLLDELNDEANPIPYMHVFALLSHLKQICNHPAAYLKKTDDYEQYQSGKWDLFVELLEEARESQQKVVVFSQYLGMLDIIENYLKANKIGFAAIRGKTIDRGEQLRRFNSDPSCEVFVASLQAVGLGVDLTAASVVIHYDRWWNAARENQATDRVHRIGQTRGVQVFKLMTKGTLEEHIDFLIKKKERLMEDVISADDHQIVKKFDRSEIINLLQLLPPVKNL